ncbi:YdcH family protein [Hyphomonas sp.]|uniref:YdcH family protein n=1 Tax=Hyphomonas sp. TaxID=87 RepID=UPI003D2A702C|tara:strand:+ start:539 stop:775 length:237 start_codon:yes stop_codon:yes gene_type:complete
MSNTPHELAEEFPELADRIHELKVSNPHFARLADEYHDVNRHIHRHESGIQPASETHETELRKRRIVLKDEIYAMLKS